MSRLTWTVCALLLLAVTPTAWAKTELGVDVGSAGVRLATSHGTRLVGDTGYGGLVLRASAELAPDLSLGLEWWHASSQPVNSVVQRELATEAGLIDARYHFHPASWLEPHLRGAVGVGYHTLQLSGGGGQLEGSAWTPIAAATAGFDLVLPRKWFRESPSKAHFTMGLSFDLGWQHVLSADWTMKGTRSLTPAVTQAGIDLGTAGLTGVVTRAAFVVRF